MLRHNNIMSLNMFDDSHNIGHRRSTRYKESRTVFADYIALYIAGQHVCTHMCVNDTYNIMSLCDTSAAPRVRDQSDSWRRIFFIRVASALGLNSNPQPTFVDPTSNASAVPRVTTKCALQARSLVCFVIDQWHSSGIHIIIILYNTIVPTPLTRSRAES